MIGSTLDRVLLTLFPSWAVGRQRARHQYQAESQVFELKAHALGMLGISGQPAYDAAKRKDRLNGTLPSTMYSADQAGMGSADMMTAMARDGVRNNSYADSIAQAHRRNIANITARSDARDPETNEPMTKFNRALDRLWLPWSKKAKWCDIEKRKSLLEIQGLMIEEFAVTGESIAVMVYERRPETVGLSVQVIEREQLDNTMTEAPGSRNEVRNGIEIDAYGAALAYWICRGKHPLESADAKPERIPADRVLHLMRQRRVRQTHGVSRMASALKRLHGIDQYDQAEIIAAWMEACQGIILPDDKKSVGYQDADGKEPKKPVFEPGMIVYGDAKPFAPQHPGKQYEGFVKTQIRAGAASTGFSYSTVARDFQGSYSSQRQEMLEENKEVDPLQELVIDSFLQQLRENFAFFAVLEGRLPVEFDEFMQAPDIYCQTDWQPPARPWIDPAREAAAEKIRLDYRLTNRADLYNRQGGNWRDGIDQISEIQTYAKGKGVTLPEDQPAGPVTSPSEPKIHGTGDEATDSTPAGPNDKPESRRRMIDMLADNIILNVLREPI